MNLRGKIFQRNLNSTRNREMDRKMFVLSLRSYKCGLSSWGNSGMKNRCRITLLKVVEIGYGVGSCRPISALRRHSIKEFLEILINNDV